MLKEIFGRLSKYLRKTIDKLLSPVGGRFVLHCNFRTSKLKIIINWQKVYLLAFQTTLESKIREFQYKILNCIVFTNEKLSRISLVESPSCTFCQEVAESVEHLLFSCKISSDFWKHVLSWLRVNNVLVGTIDESDLRYLESLILQMTSF